MVPAPKQKILYLSPNVLNIGFVALVLVGIIGGVFLLASIGSKSSNASADASPDPNHLSSFGQSAQTAPSSGNVAGVQISKSPIGPQIPKSPIPTPKPSPTQTPSPSPTATPTSTPTPTPSPTDNPTPTPSDEASPSATP